MSRKKSRPHSPTATTEACWARAVISAAVVGFHSLASWGWTPLVQVSRVGNCSVSARASLLAWSEVPVTIILWTPWAWARAMTLGKSDLNRLLVRLAPMSMRLGMGNKWVDLIVVEFNFSRAWDDGWALVATIDFVVWLNAA